MATFRLRLVTALLMPISVLALLGNPDDPNFWDDMSNNFASDLAPLISLFGEQVTTQFISESTTVLDSILFAMAPLGIITAVVSVIRACGSPFLKSVIGRSREPHGMTRVELSSSTTKDVCELWSNGGICRVFGRPKILEIMCRKPTSKDFYRSAENANGEPTCGIDLPKNVLGPLQSVGHHASGNPAIPRETNKCLKSRGDFGDWEEIHPDDVIWIPFLKNPLLRLILQPNTIIERMRRLTSPTKNPIGDAERNVKSTDEDSEQNGKPTDNDGGQKSPLTNFAPYPNLQLNMQTRTFATSILHLWLASVFGVLLQASFFAYATWATWYHPGFYEEGTHQLPFFVVCVSGTVLLVVGMALSATVIDHNSRERRFIHKGIRAKPRIFWLQPGQYVGDQLFETFAYCKEEKEYITSFTRESTAEHLVLPAIYFSILGWAGQFIGSRGLHPSIALYQFGCTIILSIIRATLRSNRFTQGKSPIPPHTPREGYELYWLSFAIRNGGELDQDNSKQTFWSITDVRRSSSSSSLRNKSIAYAHKRLLVVNLLSGCELHFQPDSVIVAVQKKEMEQKSTEGVKFSRVCHKIMKTIEACNELPNALPNDSSQLMRIRSRLAYLTMDPAQDSDTIWGADIRKVAVKLKSTMEESADYMFTRTNLFPSKEPPDAIFWSATSRCWNPNVSTEQDQLISFSMFRGKHRLEIDVNQLEAVLSLWYWTIKQQMKNFGSKSGGKNLHAKYFNKKRMMFEAYKWDDVDSMLRYWISPFSYSSDGNIAAKEWGILSIPAAIMLMEGAAERTTQSSSVKMVSTDATSPLLHLIAQDIFTIFIDRVASLGGDVLDEIELRPRENWMTSEDSGLMNRHIEYLFERLVSENLATRGEGLMTIIPYLFMRGKLSWANYLIHDLISKAQDLRRQMMFRDSEKIIEGLFDLHIPELYETLLSSLCEVYRAESRWIFRQRSFTRSEVTNRHETMARSVVLHRGSFLNTWRHSSIRDAYEIWLGNRANFYSSPTSSQNQKRLDEETLKRLLLEEPLDKAMVTFALKFGEEYKVAEFTTKTRRHILRWAIQLGLPGLVEDIWMLEKENDAETAFIHGSDEVFWAINSNFDNRDHEEEYSSEMSGTVTMGNITLHLPKYDNVEKSVIMDMVHLLINVAKVHVWRPLNDPNKRSTGDDKGPEQDLSRAVEEAWKESKVKSHIMSRYRRFGSVLASAATNPENRDIVRLLVEKGQLSINEPLGSGDHGNAIVAALWGGSTEIVGYLIDTLVKRQMGDIAGDKVPEEEELGVPLKVGDFGNILIAAAYWGRSDCVDLIIDAQQKIYRWMASNDARVHSPSYNLMPQIQLLINRHAKYGRFQTALEAAKTEFTVDHKEWADSRFVHDKAGVVALLQGWGKNDEKLQHTCEDGHATWL